MDVTFFYPLIRYLWRSRVKQCSIWLQCRFNYTIRQFSMTKHCTPTKKGSCRDILLLLDEEKWRKECLLCLLSSVQTAVDPSFSKLNVLNWSEKKSLQPTNAISQWLEIKMVLLIFELLTFTISLSSGQLVQTYFKATWVATSDGNPIDNKVTHIIDVL